MKKVFKSIFALALSSTLFFSCEKSDIISIDNDEELVKLTLIAGNPEVNTGTKTEIQGTTPYWSVGDAIGITDNNAYTNEAGNTYYKNFEFTSTITEPSRKAVFTGSTTLSPTLYAYYPYSKAGIAAQGAKVDIPHNQYPTASSFDGSGDILVSSPFEVTGETTQVENLDFTRLTAVVKIVLKDNTTDQALTGQKPSLVMINAEGSQHGLVGRVYVNLTNKTLGEIYYEKSNRAIANYTDQTKYSINDQNATYLVVYPQTLSSGSKLTVSASTEDYNIERSITLPFDIELTAGKITTINVKISDDHLVYGTPYVLHTGEIEEGDYIIYYSGKAMKAGISSNRFTYSEVTPANNVIYSDEPLIVWHIAKSGSYYTLFNAKTNKYAAGNNTNNQGALIDAISDYALWTISNTDGVFDIINKGNAAHNKNAYLRNNGTYGFACYAVGTGGRLSLFKLSDNRPEAGLAYSTTSYSINIGDSFQTPTLTNPYSVPVTYSSSNTSVASVAADGSVTILAAGTTTITASFEGNTAYRASSASYTITVINPNVTTAEYVFNTDAGLSALGITKPAQSAGTELGTNEYVVSEVTFSTTDGGTATRVWNSKGVTDLRVYKNGGSLNFSVASNKNITKIVLTGSSVNGFTANAGNYNKGTWTGSSNSVTLTASANSNINTIEVTYQ